MPERIEQTLPGNETLCLLVNNNRETAQWATSN